MKTHVVWWRFSLIVTVLITAFPTVASVVAWTSGRIVLPDGSYADAGDVHGYAFISIRSEILYAASFYDMIHDGITQSIGSTMIEANPHPYQIDFFIEQGVSDENGEISLVANGLNSGSGYNNQWARVYYTCIQDGYEYYMAVNGNHYETASSPNMKYENLASYGTWQQGYAVPEPTTAVMSLIGVCLLSLRRRIRNKISEDESRREK